MVPAGRGFPRDSCSLQELPNCWAVLAWARPSVPGFFLDVTTKLKSHRRQKLVCEIRFASRGKALIKRRRQHRRRRGRLNRRHNRPAPFARIRHVPGIALEGRLLEQRNGREVEKPRGHHAAAPPYLGDIRQIEVVLKALRVTQRRGFGVSFALCMTRVGVLQNVQPLGVSCLSPYSMPLCTIFTK